MDRHLSYPSSFDRSFCQKAKKGAQLEDSEKFTQSNPFRNTHDCLRAQGLDFQVRGCLIGTVLTIEGISNFGIFPGSLDGVSAEVVLAKPTKVRLSKTPSKEIRPNR